MVKKKKKNNLFLGSRLVVWLIINFQKVYILTYTLAPIPIFLASSKFLIDNPANIVLLDKLATLAMSFYKESGINLYGFHSNNIYNSEILHHLTSIYIAKKNNLIYIPVQDLYQKSLCDGYFMNAIKENGSYTSTHMLSLQYKTHQEFYMHNFLKTWIQGSRTTPGIIQIYTKDIETALWINKKTIQWSSNPNIFLEEFNRIQTIPKHLLSYNEINLFKYLKKNPLLLNSISEVDFSTQPIKIYTYNDLYSLYFNSLISVNQKQDLINYVKCLFDYQAETVNESVYTKAISLLEHNELKSTCTIEELIEK